MRLFHRTTEEGLKKIQEEGILFGPESFYLRTGKTARKTYFIKNGLPPDLSNRGKIILVIDYEGTEWEEVCTGIIVYESIPLSQICICSEMEAMHYIVSSPRRTG